MISSETLSVFLQKLQDRDQSERRMAAEALAEADERAIYPLIRLLRDESTGVQDAAMRSLVAIGGEVTAYMALPLLRENPFLRNTARIILRQIGQPSVPLLHSLLADKDDDVRTFAVDLISDIGWCDYPADIARLLEADPNQNVRTSAARAVAALGYRDAIPALIAALRDSEWVCFTALESLAELRDESSVGPILALLGSPSETMRYAAIEALGKIGSPRSSDILISRIPSAGDIEKIAIIKTLVQIGITPSMAEVGDLLVEMFTKGEWEERLIALTGLADLKDERAIPVILDIAGTLDPSEPDSEESLLAVKQALARFGCVPSLIAALSDLSLKFRGKMLAIEVIAELGCVEAVPHLIALLESDLRGVRRASVLALAEIHDDRALQELRKRISDRDGHVRQAAIAALGRIGDKASVPDLLTHLTAEGYKDVLEETIRTLLQLDSTALFSHLAKQSVTVKELIGRNARSIDILLALSREPEVNVRSAALSSLGKLQEERASQRLSEALKDENPEVRKTAVTALGAMNCCNDDIKMALNDNDMWVRLYAVRALADSGKPEAAKAILPLLSDKEVPVVLAVLDALIQLDSRETAALSALQNHPDAAVRERVAQVMERL